MKKFYIPLFVLFNLLSASAQTALTDSLLTELKTHTNDDTVRLKILLNLSNLYSGFNPDSGFIFAEEAIQIAQQNKNFNFLGAAYVRKAYNYSATFQFEKEIETYQFAIEAYGKTSNTEKTARCYYNSGLAYYNISNYIAAIKNYTKAIELLNSIQEHKIIFHPLNSLGIVYMQLSQNEKSMEYYLQAQKIAEQNTDTFQVITVLSNIGILNGKMNFFEVALDNFNHAITLCNKIKMESEKGRIYSHIANVYDTKSEYLKALSYNMLSLKISEEAGETLLASNTMVNIGINYTDLMKYDSAFYFLNTGALAAEKRGDKEVLAIAYSSLANALVQSDNNTLRKQGINPGKKFSMAQMYYDSSIALSKEIGSLENEMFTWQDKSKTYSVEGNDKAALESFKMYVLLKDSIAFDNARLSVQAQTLQYEFDKKSAEAAAQADKQQALASSEIQRQKAVKNLYGAAGIFLLTAGAGGFLFYKKNKEAKLNAEVAELENKALRVQMNPHFIFNSLNSISNYVAKNNTESTQEYIAKFSKVMRMILENSEQKIISLADELDFIEKYLFLEKMRCRDSFDYHIEIDKQLDIDNTFIPPMLLQPFIENSIWHGLPAGNKKGHISVKMMKKNNVLLCIVEDNGSLKSADTPQPMQTERKPMGMKITQARINLLNKLYNKAAILQTTQTEKGRHTEITLPLALQF